MDFYPSLLPFARGEDKRGRFDCGYAGYDFSFLSTCVDKKFSMPMSLISCKYAS